MGITTVITERAKDVFALGQNIAKVVKEEVDLYMNKEKEDEDNYESAVREEEDKISFKQYIEEFEGKAKDMIQNAFSGFKSSKKEEQKELEARIAALEEKLGKLVEESLESFKKEDATRI